MSREIKFRVWVESILEEETGMYIPDYISWAKNGDVHNIDKVYAPGYKFKEDTCKFTLMQYTGLKDKNGTEIYEGDIIMVVGKKFEGIHIITVEQYQETCESGWRLSITGWYQDEMQIVGNIYENPEKLT